MIDNNYRFTESDRTKDNRVEAKLLESLYDLTELRVCKLT